MTPGAVDNALRILLAISGSTNAIIHLTAIAGRAGIEVTLDQLNRLSDTTPVLVDLKPTGAYYMEDLHAAGGIGAVMRELRPLLNLDCMTVTGQTLRQRLDADTGWVDRAVVRSFDDPLQPQGGLVALFGSLAPRGAILKRAAYASGKLILCESYRGCASSHCWRTASTAAISSSVTAGFDCPPFAIRSMSFRTASTATAQLARAC